MVGTSFADRWIDAARRCRAPVCVGLDPVLEHLPPEFRPEAAEAGDSDVSRETNLAAVAIPDDARAADARDADARAADALRRFCRRVIDIAAPHVPAVKVNIAFFERHRAAGVEAYYEVGRYARQAGLLVIGDIKRGDIGHSAGQYAAGHLGASRMGGASDPATISHRRVAGATTARVPLPGQVPRAACPPVTAPCPSATGGADATDAPGTIDVVDAVTVSPYLGFDGVGPFIDAAAQNGRGVFVLVQTSNDSAAAIQGLRLADGRTVAEAVGALVESWSCAAGPPGRSGYGCVGAVVSPRDLDSTVRLRAMMPHCVFLVPGFGAQGRSAQEVAHCFKPDGTGAIVNASRSILRAFDQPAYRDRFHLDWSACVRQACIDFVQQIRAACNV